MSNLESTFKKSQEWLDRRLKTIGGSDIPVIMGKSPYKTPYQLWTEKTQRSVAPDISNAPHVVRGHLSEEVARARLERETLTSYRPKFWRHPMHDFMAVNDDGYSVQNNWFLEVKAMGLTNHNIVKEGAKSDDYGVRISSIPAHYLDQIQYNLMVSKCVKCIFISYRVEDDDMVCIDVFPDPAHQKELEDAAKFFWFQNIQADVPPALTDKDFIKVSDANLEKKLTRFKELNDQVKKLTDEVDALKEEIRPYASKHPAICTPTGAKISITSRSGGTDYAKYCRDKNITDEELKAYKKKPSSVFSIRFASEK